MNASDIIRLLHSNHYAPADLEDVKRLCTDFPEFSAAHLLKLRILEALGHEKQKQLKLAAVYSMNRSKLLELVREVREEPQPQPEASEENSELFNFTEEGDEQANVIIEQHAPYAGPQQETDLIELDEKTEEDLLEIVDEEGRDQPDEDPQVEEELTTDELLSSMVKNEAEMEEPETSPDETPAMDQVDEVKKESNRQLISRFIKNEPGPIRADKGTSLKGDISRASVIEHDGFITDTLAQIYVKQGLYAKAIYAYEKLSLKYPEKSAYFAAQIEKIRNINHS